MGRMLGVAARYAMEHAMKGQPPSGSMKETFMEHEVEKNIFFLFLALQSRKELKWDDLFRHHLI